MVKQTAYNESLLHNETTTKIRTTDTSNNLNDSLDDPNSEKKPIPKCHMCDSIYITFLKWQNYRNRTRLSTCWEKDGSECDYKNQREWSFSVAESFILIVLVSVYWW